MWHQAGAFAPAFADAFKKILSCWNLPVCLSICQAMQGIVHEISFALRLPPDTHAHTLAHTRHTNTHGRPPSHPASWGTLHLLFADTQAVAAFASYCLLFLACRSCSFQIVFLHGAGQFQSSGTLIMFLAYPGLENGARPLCLLIDSARGKVFPVVFFDQLVFDAKMPGIAIGEITPKDLFLAPAWCRAGDLLMYRCVVLLFNFFGFREEQFFGQAGLRRRDGRRWSLSVPNCWPAQRDPCALVQSRFETEHPLFQSDFADKQGRQSSQEIQQWKIRCRHRKARAFQFSRWTLSLSAATSAAPNQIKQELEYRSWNASHMPPKKLDEMKNLHIQPNMVVWVAKSFVCLRRHFHIVSHIFTLEYNTQIRPVKC